MPLLAVGEEQPPPVTTVLGELGRLVAVVGVHGLLACGWSLVVHAQGIRVQDVQEL